MVAPHDAIEGLRARPKPFFGERLGKLLAAEGLLPVGTKVRLKGDPALHVWTVLAVRIVQTSATDAVLEYGLSLALNGALYDLCARCELLQVLEFPAAEVEPQPVPPPVAEFCAVEAEDPEMAPGYEPAGESEEPPAGEIGWVQHSHTGRVSADGRFVITTLNPPGVDARDAWTHTTTTHATEREAIDWCADRLRLEHLRWAKCSADRWVTKGLYAGVYEVHLSPVSPGFYGVDTRFDALSRFRESPLFATRAAAIRWCQLRAACVPEQDKERGEWLLYSGPIPF